MEFIGSIDGTRVRLAIVNDRWLILSEVASGREIAQSMLNYPVSLEDDHVRWGDRLILVEPADKSAAATLVERVSGKPAVSRPRTDAVTNTIPPPPAVMSARGEESSKRQLVILGMIAAIVLVAFLLARGSGGDDSVTVEYTIEVFTDAYCEDFSGTGYDDLPFAEVEVIDGEGRLLGSSNLDGGYDLSNSCVFSAEFRIRKSGDGMYRITAGNSNRGYLNYNRDDISNGRLVAEASLGE
jgi:hypothetical protein